MEKHIEFTINDKELGSFTVTCIVDVPDSWFFMDENEQREFLIKPMSENHHPGKIVYGSSRFQKATGAYDVLDFQFETSDGYIVELEQGVWLAPWSGNPGRTLKKSSARLYANEHSAAIALGKARKFRKFRNAVITAV